MNLQFIYFYYVDELIINLLLLVLTCTGDWVKGPGMFCYLVVFDKKIWHEAAYDCSVKGGDLISIQNKEENDFVQSMFLLIFVL